MYGKRDSTMASIFKPKGKTKYVIFYTDETGRRRKKIGATDKAVTQRMAAKLENDVALRKQGLIDPTAERYANQERKPIRGHLDDFIKTLEAARRNAKHVRSTRTYIERVVVQTGAMRLSDLTASAVMLALSRIAKDEELSARGVNAHATAIKSFARWAWRDGRSRAYELATIGRLNEEADRRYVRRPLSDDELRLLIRATRSTPEWRGMSGVDRSWFYVLGAVTGFRRSELGALRPEDFALNGPTPVVRLGGEFTKNGKPAEQPLPPTLADELRSWLAGKAPMRPVFTLPEKTGQMLHADLRRCGIEPVDGEGRVVDTHSLRHGYISALARSGVPVKVVQTLARHSDPKLTLGIYSHLSAFDLHGAVGHLPDLTNDYQQASTPAMTGTGEPGATQFATLPTDGSLMSLPANEIGQMDGRLLISGL
jgi:integrase/recombinase XerD